MTRPDGIRDLDEILDPESKLPHQENEFSKNGTRSLNQLLTTENSLVEIADRILPYWSRARDRFLWRSMIQSDLLSSALNITTSRLYSIPFNIVPKDKENRRVREVSYWSDLLLKESWSNEMYRFVLDWQGQDNGAFMEILGGGSPDGPIEPTLVPGTSTYLYGLGLRHLDSQACIRTGNPEYPVVYEAIDDKGKFKRYKLHYTRVLFSSQMPSPRERHFGVGFCAASRAMRNILHMDDISILKEEWLGSRPISEIIFGKGITAQQLEEAFNKADLKANNDGLKRYAKMVYIGIDGAPEYVRSLSIERIPLKRLPEGYDEERAVKVAINIIAMAFGFDARTFMPATSAGATTADAQYQHLKTMRMTPGVWANTMESQLSRKYAPQTTYASAEQQDDEQDRIKAENQAKRAQIRQVMLDSGQIDPVVCFQMMLDDGDINDEQYDYLVKKHEDDQKKLEEQLSASQLQSGMTDPNTSPDATRPIGSQNSGSDKPKDNQPAAAVLKGRKLEANQLWNELFASGNVQRFAS